MGKCRVKKAKNKIVASTSNTQNTPLLPSREGSAWWQLVVQLGVVVAILAGAVAILDYIRPDQSVVQVDPGKVPVTPFQKLPELVSYRETAFFEKTADDKRAIPSQMIFFIPPKIKFNVQPGSAIFNAKVDLGRRFNDESYVHFQQLSHADFIDVHSVLNNGFNTEFGSYEIRVEKDNQVLLDSNFDLIKVWEPGSIVHRTAKKDSELSAFYNDDGFLKSVKDGYAVYERKSDVFPFSKDDFSQIVFEEKILHPNGVRVSGWFALEDEGGNVFQISPEFVVQDSSFGRAISVIIANGSNENHQIIVEGENPFGQEVLDSTQPNSMEVIRDGSTVHYFQVEYLRSGINTVVQLYLSLKPVDPIFDSPVAKREVQGWLFNRGADSFRIRVWRHGIFKLSAVQFEEWTN